MNKPSHRYMDPAEYAQFFVERRKPEYAGSNLRSDLPMDMPCESIGGFFNELGRRKDGLADHAVHHAVRFCTGGACPLELVLTARDGNLTLTYTHGFPDAQFEGSVLSADSKRRVLTFIEALKQKLRGMGLELRG